MCTCDRLGWNTSRPWFRASLMEGICPEAFHLAHNREPGTHLDCICTVGAWPQRKEIIDPELQCCRGSGQLLVFLFTSAGNALIYMRANIKLWIVLAKPAPENRFMPVRVLDSCSFNCLFSLPKCINFAWASECGNSSLMMHYSVFARCLNIMRGLMRSCVQWRYSVIQVLS